MDDLPPIKLNADVIEKLKTELSSTSYREAIKNSSSYNNRLVVERKTRLPFIDSQTGVAQNDCYLWMQKWERMPGQIEGQVYSYPVRRWKKKRRQYLLNNVYPSMNGMKTENQSESGYEQNGLNGVENVPHHDESQESKYFADKDPGNSWMSEYDDTAVELPDAGELDGEQDSDFDDYEEYTTSRKKKRKKAESGRKKKTPVASVGGDPALEKPYQCDICKMRYKTRPGLTYHYSHNHPNEAAERRVPSAIAEEEDSQQSLGAASNNGVSSRTSQTNSSSNSPLPPLGGRMTNVMASSLPAHLLNPSAGPGSVPSSPIPGNNGNAARFNNGEMSKDGTKQKKSSAPSNYCDFCLGNSEINKKTKMSEEMISCSDCGRSAHPTCLQFTANMLLSVKKYRWQCLECKSCGLCGTSDNDDQLLFCDDCDRGYHMYCLQPPLSEPPEGSWSCHLCIEEYHKPKVATPNDSMLQVEPQSQLVKQPQTDNLTENNTSAPTPSTPTPAQLTVPPIASTGP